MAPAPLDADNNGTPAAPVALRPGVALPPRSTLRRLPRSPSISIPQVADPMGHFCTMGFAPTIKRQLPLGSPGRAAKALNKCK